MFTCTLVIVDLCWATMKCVRSCFITLLRYNDLTRPRSMQQAANNEELREHTAVGESGRFFASTPGDVRRLHTERTEAIRSFAG